MAIDHVNAWALDDGDGWTLVDPGLDAEPCRSVMGALLAGPLSGKPVRRVIVTHHHPDHIGLAGRFAERGAEIVTTRVAWLTARMLRMDAPDRPTAATLAFWRGAGMDPDLFARRAAERPARFADRVAPLPGSFTRIAEGDRIVAGGRRWRVALGEGHAPEHAVMFSEDDDLVIGGDQLLPSISANIAVHPWEPEADPLGAWLDSCERLSILARPAQLVLPGHRTPFLGLPQRLRQMRENHLSALVRLRRLLAGGARPACDCFPALFRRRIGPEVYDLAMGEAMANLNWLLRRGEAQRAPGPGGLWLWSLTQPPAAQEDGRHG